MMESHFETPFKVIFFDGNATMDMGNIFIRPYLNFKAFQSIVSQKIGVSPNQITTYYERGPLSSRSGKFNGGNRRSPVTNKFNFASILFDSNCFFFVVLKRSRRVRNRNKKQNLHNYPTHGDINSPEGYDFRFANPNFPVHGTYCPNYAELEYLDHRRSFLERERGRYMLTRYLNSIVYSDLDLVSRMSYRSSLTSDDGASTSGGVSFSGGVCEKCVIAKKEFHLCNCDAILTPSFRSPFGPIARPARKRVELLEFQ